MALADPAAQASVPLDSLRSDPVVRVGRRFLPVAATALPPLPTDPGVVVLPLAPGTPVHAMQSGRVVAAEGPTGEIVLGVESEVRLVYRKLLPSSITVSTGDTVESGDVIGVVAPGLGRRLAALELGIQLPDGSWEQVATWLVGLPDPLELYVNPPDAAAPGAVRSRPAAATRPAPITIVRPEPEADQPTSPPPPPPDTTTQPEPKADQPPPPSTEPVATDPSPDPTRPDDPDASLSPSATRHSTTEDEAPAITSPSAAGKSEGTSKLTSRRHKVRSRPDPAARRTEPDGPRPAEPASAGSTPDQPVAAEPLAAQPSSDEATVGQSGTKTTNEAEPTQTQTPDRSAATTPDAPAVSISVPSAEPAPPPASNEVATKADEDPDGDTGPGTTDGSDRVTQVSRLTGRRRPRRSGS